MSLKIEDGNVLVKYNKIWNKIKKMLSIKFHNQPASEEKYVKTKVKTFGEVVNAFFSDDNIPKEGIHHICLTVICINSVMKIDKTNYYQVYLEQCKYKIER